MRGEFGEIALGSGRFEINFEALAQIGARGAERVEFLFAANAGEPARALARVASGGELSRVLLALVVALAQARDAGGALVFDEIDAGIGGATATAVGARVGELARTRTSRLRHAFGAARDVGRPALRSREDRAQERNDDRGARARAAPKNARPKSRACSRASRTTIAVRHARALSAGGAEGVSAPRS